MRGILRSSLYTEIDLGDGAVPVAPEEACQLSLEKRRERACAVLSRKIDGAPRVERVARHRIIARAARDLPQREVHLGRGVVRQTAKHCLQLPGSRVAFEEAIRECIARDSWDD